MEATLGFLCGDPGPEAVWCKFVPMTHELSELELSYKDEGAIALVKEIAEAWKQVHRVTPGNYTDATTEGYPVWHARRGSGFLAPKVYGPNLPIPMTDDAEDIRMGIEAQYELATDQLQAENSTLSLENKRLKAPKRRALDSIPNNLPPGVE